MKRQAAVGLAGWVNVYAESTGAVPGIRLDHGAINTAIISPPTRARSRSTCRRPRRLLAARPQSRSPTPAGLQCQSRWSARPRSIAMR